MLMPNQHRIWIFFLPGAVILTVLTAVLSPCGAGDIFLSPPGLRPLKDPAMVIPADYRYPNALIRLPTYRDANGKPADGWSNKFIPTRRFVSNQSAWIYFRISDFKRSVSAGKSTDKSAFRFWPVGTTVIIESYLGNARHMNGDDLVEIAVMSKTKGDRYPPTKAFYPVNWNYARFNPDGSSSITSAKIRECHQCHSIAFHLTGDLIFTNFP